MRSRSHIPPRMRVRKRILKSGKIWIGYYYDGRTELGKRIELPLGTDYNAALRKWAEMEHSEPPVETNLLKHIFARYVREVIPTRSTRTQVEYRRHIQVLDPVFGHMPIDQIKPMHIAAYRDNRTAKTSANREISRLSHVFNKAREWGYTDRENPCHGVQKNKEYGRNFYADDEVWEAIRKHAAPELLDALDLAYLTGQRPADVCKMLWSDITNGALTVEQNKSIRDGQVQKRLRIKIVGELSAVIARIRAKCELTGFAKTIISTSPRRWGKRPIQSLTESMRRDRMDEVRQKAFEVAMLDGNENLAYRIKKFQFRDTRAKAASDIEDIAAASKLLGHSKERITKDKYRRNGETVNPSK